MSKVYKIIIYDPKRCEKARVKVNLNMSLSDVAAEIKRLFGQREESAKAAENAIAAIPVK